MKDAAQRKLDCALVLKLDRFGRSVPDLVASLQELDSAGVRFVAISQGIDTDQANSSSRLLLNVLACIASFEREVIRERVGLGYQTYRADYASGKAVTSKSGKNLPVGRSQAHLRP
jgi:putative DNA-invertase from lambdoid prophage Rac